MLFGNLHSAYPSYDNYFHKSSEIYSAEFFQFFNFLNNFIQFLIHSSLNSRIQFGLLRVALRLRLQFNNFMLQLLIYITLKSVNLESVSSSYQLSDLFQFRIQFLNKSTLISPTPFFLRLSLVQEIFKFRII